MTYSIERLPDEPVIVVTWLQSTDVAKEAPGEFAEVDALIGPDEKVFVINDLSALQTNFGGIVTGMAAQVLPQTPGAPSDPRIHSILIASGALWEMAVKGAKQLQYGGLDIPLVPSREAALAYARERINAW